MDMDREACSCGDKDAEIACRMCGNETPLPYWCETCQRLVPEKRCQCCGLKARKVIDPARSDVKLKARDKAQE